jgi:hypothetical protein
MAGVVLPRPRLYPGNYPVIEPKEQEKANRKWTRIDAKQKQTADGSAFAKPMARRAPIYADKLAAKERRERKMEMAPQAYSSREAVK